MPLRFLLLKKVQQARSFADVRLNLKSTQPRMKFSYDVGSTPHLFKPGDSVRIRITKLHATPGAKLRSVWSDPIIVTETKGPVVNVKDPSSGKTQTVH